jgi:hypothetical protein
MARSALLPPLLALQPPHPPEVDGYFTEVDGYFINGIPALGAVV